MGLDLDNIGSQVDTQLSDLAQQIRTAEDSLMRLKETYLKVQGAKEMLTIIREEDKPAVTSPEHSMVTDTAEYIPDGTAD